MQTLFDALPVGAYLQGIDCTLYFWKDTDSTVLIFRGYVGDVPMFYADDQTLRTTQVRVDRACPVVASEPPPTWMTTRYMTWAVRQ